MDHQRTSFLNENDSGDFLDSDGEDMAQDFAAFVKENKQNQSYVNTSMMSTSSSKQFNTSRMHDSHCRTGVDHSRMSSFSYMNPIPKSQKPVRSPIPMDNDFENCNPNVTKRDKGAPSKGSQKMTKNTKSKKKHNSNHKEVKVLVIGATGAGKSSLINLFYVWSQKWSPIDLVSGHKRVVIRTKHLDGDGEAETDVKNQGVSQTTKAKHYSFELKNENTGVHYSLNFLDTPGLGDTSGIEKDDFHLELIMDTVGKTDGLNAILLVMNGADARINARVRYIMIRLQGMIPDALRQNLVVLLTNVGLEPNLDIRKVLDFKIDDNNVFYYDNQIFALDPSKIGNHNVQRKVNQSYKDSIDTLSAMLDRISSCSVKPTKEFIVIKEARDELKKKLVECNDADARIYKKKQELQKLAADIASGQLKIGDLQKQLNQTVSEDNFTSQPTSYHNTTCLTCKSCCHEHCMLNETTQQGVPYFQQCAAFNGNATCNACSHSYTSHVHLRLKYVKTTTQVQKFDPNIQASIQKAQNDADAQNKAHNAIDAEIRKLDAELQKSQGEIMSIVAKMQKVCSRFDYIKEIEACINVLDEQIDTATSDFSQTLNEDDATKVDGLQKTKAKMVKLKNDLVKYLKSSKTQ